MNTKKKILTKRLEIRMSPAELDRLNRLAAKLSVSVSEYVRACIGLPNFQRTADKQQT